ncbi:MAG: transglycosylase domain-containing protein [Rubricoccaceae bacterium]
MGLTVAVLTPVLIGGLAIGVYAYTLLPQMPDAYELARATQAQPSIVYAANGEPLTQFEPAFQEWVPLDSIPIHVVDALLATEDRKFYRHNGVDYTRTVAALWNTFTGRREGGSTITQQLARNLFPDAIGNAGTAERKIKEALASYTIERDHTKREILEAYLNTVPFLYNAHGLEMAARTYFGSSAGELTVAQGATLVAMLKGPSEYNPVRNPEAALRRRNLVLRQMAATHVLATSDAAAARSEPLGVELQRQPGRYSAAPHFTDAVRRQLEAWAAPRGYDVDRDGLIVRTTLDPAMQRAAVEAVEERAVRLDATARREWSRGPPRAALNAALQTTRAYDRLRQTLSAEDALAAVRGNRDLVDSVRAMVVRPEAALVALDPESGAVRAYVGSRDYRLDEYDHAGVALRQPGSTFKAFVFAGALQRGYGPSDEVDGRNVSIDLGGGDVWSPTGGRSSGTLEDGLVFSKNAVTARLTQEMGPERVALTARMMGVTSRLDPVPSIGLGTSPVTLLEMVGAYGTIANDGIRRDPLLITRIETQNGTVLETFGGPGRQALTRRDARTLLDMMRGVVDRGTARDLRTLGATGDLAGKTGTTQRYVDGWFIGMRPGLVVGSWVGFNDQRVRFRSKATGEGSKTALPVVAAFLKRVQDALPNRRFPDPPGWGRAYGAVAPDSLYGDALEDLPGDFDPDAYQDSYGEDPFDPAPTRQPEVERPEETARPDLRPTPPVARPQPAPAPSPPADTSSAPASSTPAEESEGDTRAGEGTR